MSDGLSDDARTQREAEDYFFYLEALRVSGLIRPEVEGKYLIALPVPETGVVITRADKKEQP